MDPISAGIAGVAQVFKGISGFFASRTEAKIDQAAARQAAQEAGVATSQALGQGEAAAADAAVQGAANGGGFVGSTLGVIQSIANRSMFNARAAAYRGNTQAQADLYNAKVAKKQGIVNLIGSFGAAGADVYAGKRMGDFQNRQLAALSSLRGGAPGPLDGLEEPVY